ncbi:MAG: response regulator transcription factor [Candidatus Mcinerneyibacterium aminivorans]|uniref:Response regulator transcription factor n=1 Tax=Candidatus Mcinerneyibacterium aminivorans TaxID=2703815 RepID=A0A5D0MJQ3_9BACT|nr:MAG: response regulator transcription factor [Candidatus Mcinerneyibacterium aminivorans]
MIKIQIVEDEKKIANIVKKYLAREGYRTKISSDGEKALKDFNKFDPDLLILDRMLPNKSGDEVLKWINRIKEIPVIMLTAKDKEDEILNGFKIGVDDYITKPFSPRILVERVKNILKRSDRVSFKDNIIFDSFEMYTSSMEVKIDDKMIGSFSAKEFEILYLLAKNPTRIFSREQIYDIIFKNSDSFYRTIDTHIKNIRKKIEKNPKNPKFIHTVYGKGYKFEIKQ